MKCVWWPYIQSVINMDFIKNIQSDTFNILKVFINLNRIAKQLQFIYLCNLEKY